MILIRVEYITISTSSYDTQTVTTIIVIIDSIVVIVAFSFFFPAPLTRVVIPLELLL